MPQSKSRQTWDVLYFLVAFRLVNALTIATFFQPDEYYQSLEPAWWFAFGNDSGAWLTWEWEHQLRSALQPALFSLIYRASIVVCQAFNFSTTTQASVLLAGPKVLQSFIAALGDYYTFKLAKQIYGNTFNTAWYALVLTIVSPWQWFCSTRTFSNCLETTLTTAALYHWPHHWALGTNDLSLKSDEKRLRIRWNDSSQKTYEDESTRLRQSLVYAAFAVILRPTNVIIWITLTLMTFGRGMWHRGMRPELKTFLREGILCGSMVLACSAIVDRIFYRAWTLPAWNFLKFNVFQSIAVFYGNNNWHYYLSQGYPLLLTTAIIWAGKGLLEALTGTNSLQVLTEQSKTILHRLAIISIVLPTVLSVLSHKEVRFIYPILPALHVLAASPFAQTIGVEQFHVSLSFRSISLRKWAVIFSVMAVNVAIAGYTSIKHGSGVIAITDYLRHEFETHYFHDTTSPKTNLTFAIFMPCHSTPWRSHLQYSPTLQTTGISGWALTCEPPLNLDLEAKAKYLDEADIFYNDPPQWMRRHMSRGIPPAAKPKPGVFAKEDVKALWRSPHKDSEIWLHEGEGGRDEMKRKRAWPDYIVFFEQLLPVMNRVLENSAYMECARFFNSHGHDDRRRKGDVLVWCLYPERAVGNT